jgi:hypothetical protein
VWQLTAAEGGNAAVNEGIGCGEAEFKATRDLFLVLRRRELGLGFHGVPRFRPRVVMPSASVVVLVS